MSIGSVLVNGKNAVSLSVFDRALQFGDGLFETIAIVEGVPCLWHRHLRRLTESCERLNIPVPAADLLYSEVMKIAAEQTQCVVKILLTRGCSERGYAYADTLVPNRIIYSAPWPGLVSRLSINLRLQICNTRLGLNPTLAGLKHTGRLEQVLAKAELPDGKTVEGLMLDINDNVIEGTASNIFVDIDGILHTPLLTHSGVTGVVRGLLQDTANSMATPVIEREIQIDDLHSATAIYITSSLLGIVPVSMFGDSAWSHGNWDNPIVQAAQQVVFHG